MIVNARMYSATPAASQAWKTILGWATARAGLPWEIYDYEAPAPLAALWARSDLGCVMMCGLPYSERQSRLTLIAAPVPSPIRYGGKPIYFTDIAVRAGAPFTCIEDTFGGVVGFTVRDSMSGYMALRSHLLPFRNEFGRPLYRKAIGGFVNAKSIVEALAAGQIDVGPLDSYYYDLLKAGAPEFAAKVKTIGSTDAAPIPPMVATTAMLPPDLVKLRSALDAVSNAPELVEERATLLLERFAMPAESDYSVVASLAKATTELPEPW